MGRPLVALIQQKTGTTSPPDDQSLDLFDPSGRQRSLSELARAGTARRDAAAMRRESRIPTEMKDRLSREGMARLSDALKDNPDWDVEDMKRWETEQ